MQYRRLFIPGSTVFFTLVTYKRSPVFSSDKAVSIFRESIQKVCSHHPFTIVAAVVLPDHIHMLWTLPENDTDYPMRWRLIKSNFSHRWHDPFSTLIPDSRKAKGERTVWQRRYWEHTIRDESDLTRHIEYIHYNPVKHGYVQSPVNWQPSSFHTYVNKGIYPNDWADKSDFNFPTGYE